MLSSCIRRVAWRWSRTRGSFSITADSAIILSLAVQFPRGFAVVYLDLIWVRYAW